MADTTFELISICAAEPGWRASFAGSSPGPVVAWGVFRKRQGTTDLGISMEGLVANYQIGATTVQNFDCAAAASNFEGYLAP